MRANSFLYCPFCGVSPVIRKAGLYGPPNRAGRGPGLLGSTHELYPPELMSVRMKLHARKFLSAGTVVMLVRERKADIFQKSVRLFGVRKRSICSRCLRPSWQEMQSVLAPRNATVALSVIVSHVSWIG